ncbi:MAG: hypothetical protein ABIJ96_03085 [Elusimicrobiota bacterium]
MRKALVLFAVFALICPSANAARSLEELSSGASAGLAESFAGISAVIAQPAIDPPPAQEPREGEEAAPAEPILRRPLLVPLGPMLKVGPLIGEFKLAERLDSHSDLFTLQLGAKTYDISLAADPKFDIQYMKFLNEDTLILHRVQNANELRGKGIDVRLDEKTVYNFKVSVNIFNPTRGSTLKVTPVGGTRGPSHSIKTGSIFDAIKRESFVFRAGGQEFWLLYGTDIDPAADQPAATRSLLFVHENGLKSKAWPVAEGQLTADKPLVVGLGDTRIALVKSADGRLRIHQPSAALTVSRR